MSLPKAVLYYSPTSVWSATVLLALEEKGYGDDEVVRKQIDLWKGGQFEPSFLRLSPKATVPTLVVPLQKTLSIEVESRYKAIADTKGIVDLLDKSRSIRSRTHTTSDAPAPALTPATIAGSTISTRIIDLLHSEEGDPNTWCPFNAQDHQSLKALARARLPGLSGRQSTLARCLAEAEDGTIQVSEKVQEFWRMKKAMIDEQIDVLGVAEKSDDELDEEGRKKRAAFLNKSEKAWKVDLKDILLKVNKEMVAPFALGDQLSVADLHLAAWVTRLVKLAGGNVDDDGRTAMSKVEAHIDGGFSLPKDSQVRERVNAEKTRKESRLATFWDAVKGRESWKKIYGEGLY